MAAKLRETYESKILMREKPIGLPPIEQIQSQLLHRLLDPEGSNPPKVRALLREKLGMEPEPAAPPAPAATNAAPAERISNR